VASGFERLFLGTSSRWLFAWLIHLQPGNSTNDLEQIERLQSHRLFLGCLVRTNAAFETCLKHRKPFTLWVSLSLHTLIFGENLIFNVNLILGGGLIGLVLED